MCNQKGYDNTAEHRDISDSLTGGSAATSPTDYLTRLEEELLKTFWRHDLLKFLPRHLFNR
jgi:hypothetical protein